METEKLTNIHVHVAVWDREGACNFNVPVCSPQICICSGLFSEFENFLFLLLM